MSQIQLDELFALVAEWRTQLPTEAEAAEALDRLPRRPRWVWTAIDPVSKVFIHWSVGARSLTQAQAMVHQLVQRLAKGAMPLFLSDGLSYYRIALLTHFGHWWQPPRRSAYGLAPKPRWCPLTSLQYAQVVKKCRRRRLVKLIRRVVFGGQQTIKKILEVYGWHINTAFVERLNLTLRQHVNALARRTSQLAKTQLGLERSLALFQCYYNLCLPPPVYPPIDRPKRRPWPPALRPKPGHCVSYYCFACHPGLRCFWNRPQERYACSLGFCTEPGSIRLMAASTGGANTTEYSQLRGN